MSRWRDAAGHTPPFAQRDLWNMSSRLDHSGFAPENLITLAHFSVSSTMSLLKSEGERKHRTAKIGNSCLDPGFGKGDVDFLVELVNDFSRRVLGRRNAMPADRFVSGNEVAYCRDVRQHIRTSGAGHSQRAQPATPDVLD